MPRKKLSIEQKIRYLKDSVLLLPSKKMTVTNCLDFSFLILIVLTSLIGYSQELPSIKNFHPIDYDGENQNWAISQSSEKLIYIANSKGLLEFNGAYWKQYLSPNESVMRCVKVVDDLIYTGSYMEFGFWKKNDFQTLDYTSISQQIEIDLLEDEEFWNILNIDDWMVFQSLSRIYIYNVHDGSMNFIDSDSRITRIFEIKQEVYVQIIGKGLFRINDGKAVLFLEDELVKKNEIINIFGNAEDLLILTKENGFYRSVDNTMSESNEATNDILSKLSIYDAIQLENKGFALGTIAKGLFILNEKEEIISNINLEQGLINNTVLAIFEDKSNNIWLGLDNGISYINTNSPYGLHNENNEILGSVYASMSFNGNLYLGTNQGLYFKQLGSQDNFKFVEGTQGQVWSLKIIDNILLCGHDSGTFIVNEGQVKEISHVPGTWNIARIDKQPNLLLQGNYDGLYILKRTTDGWELRNKLMGFNNSSRYFETLDGEIFVNHEYKGIFRLEVDNAYTRVDKVEIDDTLKGSDSGIAKYNGDLLYAYKKGIFKYNKENHKFIKDTLLSKAYTEDDYESGKLTVNDKENSMWIFTKSNIVFISPTGLTNKQRSLKIPLTSEARKGIVGYENISSLGDNKYLIGTTSGYTKIDISKEGAEDFTITIDKVINGSSKIDRTPQKINLSGDYNTNENNFEISFFTPEYNKYVNTQYQYQLIGLYDDWSEWSKISTVLFENLPHGNFTFNVRSKIGETISSNIATYSFEIKKPWYISTVMLFLYAFGFVMILLLIHTMYKGYYKKQHQMLMAKNERELNLTNVKNERKIIELKNEKLNAEILGKSKELAASLMSIAKKNDLLRSIKEDLKKKKNEDSVKSVINTINSSLKQNDDWQFFQEAFNNADSEFLKNLKELHPVLTPSDLKLCAYLRLNLSTKEMSDLLNITPRSVEIKRYRLRKKLNLVHEDNLVNYILGI